MNHNIQACQVIGIDIAKNSFAVHGADGLFMFNSGKLVRKPYLVGHCGNRSH